MTSVESLANPLTADPIPILSARWGTITQEARRKVAALEDSLRELDQVTHQLGEHGAVVATDLGATGNAARSAYQASRDDEGARTFALPKAVA